jgi:DedD protein
MRDNDLDDLILEDEESKSSNGLKNILTIVALIIIILIVAILLTKVILKEPKSDELAFEQTYNKTIDPELKLEKENNQTAQTIKAENLTVLIDEESNATEPKQETQINEPTKIEEEKEASTQPSTSSLKEKEMTTATVPSTIQTGTKIETKTTQTPKQTTTKEIYYVQVGAYQNQPNKAFLDVIQKSGYKYEIKKLNNKTKLLIGPYNSKEEASSALIRIKDRINKNAFLVQY